MNGQHYDTKFWNVNLDTIDENHPAIKEAANAIQNQEAVAFPTETVYGLGADATNDQAVDKIFQAKGRPGDNPLIVHLAGIHQVEMVAEEIPEMAIKLMNAFWPGPLTLILKSNGASADNVTAGLSTVGVRIPDHPVANAILTASRLPIAAPSANQSGRPSPTTAQHVWDDLAGKIFGVMDGGPTGVGVESTVVDCTSGTAVILRPGGITKEDLEKVIGPVQSDPALDHKHHQPKSPGMKYTHYAPNAPLWIIDGSIEAMQNEINRLQAEGKKVGVMTSEENADHFQHVIVKSCGSRKNLLQVAQKIYDVLRSFNEEDVDIIISEAFPKEGVGVAIMNRLEKAASNLIKI